MDQKLVAPNAQDVQKLKIILLGDFGVGKSSIINQYVHGKFQKGEVLHFREPLWKDVLVPLRSLKGVQNEVATQRVILQIHDTGGREHPDAGGLEAGFFSNASACILVYDVNKQASMKSLPNWHNACITRGTPNARDIPFIVLGNKYNPKNHRKEELQNDVATTWCDGVGIRHFLTSAKDNQPVVEAFELVARLALQSNKQEPSPKPPIVPANDPSPSSLLTPPPPKPSIPQPSLPLGQSPPPKPPIPQPPLPAIGHFPEPLKPPNNPPLTESIPSYSENGPINQLPGGKKKPPSPKGSGCCCC